MLLHDESYVGRCLTLPDGDCYMCITVCIVLMPKLEPEPEPFVYNTYLSIVKAFQLFLVCVKTTAGKRRKNTRY